MLLYSVFCLEKLASMERKKSVFFQNQMPTLFSFLNDCNKVALLLPQYACKEVARKLVRNGHRHIFVGKEVFTNVTEVFSLRGFVPNYLQWRIKGMEMSGIWDWWNRIVGYKYLLKRNAREMSSTFEKPTMSGKILVVFIVLLIGMSVATIGLIIESYKVLLKKGWQTICLLFITAQLCEKASKILEKDPRSYDFTSTVSLKIYKSSRSYSKM